MSVGYVHVRRIRVIISFIAASQACGESCPRHGVCMRHDGGGLSAGGADRDRFWDYRFRGKICFVSKVKRKVLCLRRRRRLRRWQDVRGEFG